MDAAATPENTGADQNRSNLFKPGQSGNPAGRPKGARSKLGEDFLRAMQEDFAANGKVAVETVRIEKPDAYLKVIASILPKEIELGDETTNALVVNILRLADANG